MTPRRLAAAFAGRRGVVKSALLDQTGRGRAGQPVRRRGAVVGRPRSAGVRSTRCRAVEVDRAGRGDPSPTADHAGAGREHHRGAESRRCARRARRASVTVRHSNGVTIGGRTDRVVSASSAVIRADASLSWHNRGAVPAFLPRLGSMPSPVAAVVGAGDPGSSRLVYAMVIGLVVVGVALVLLASLDHPADPRRPRSARSARTDGRRRLEEAGSIDAAPHARRGTPRGRRAR